MTIAKEFSHFDDEADFTQRFLVPLLKRLGFEIVVNYHGTREFGIDLLFAEIDRFCHIRYHGMQVKLVPSIGKEATHDLVQDCEEAFAVEFVHPETGERRRISSFYGVNGGNISDSSRDLFFAKLQGKHGDNVRLIDAKGLLGLDRSVAISRVSSERELLTGLLLETRFNGRVFANVFPQFQNIAAGDGSNVSYPPLRLRMNALSTYLQQPFATNDMPIDALERFWTMASAFNRALDGVGASPLHTVKSIKVPAIELLSIKDRLIVDLAQVESAVIDVISKLGPLVAL